MIKNFKAIYLTYFSLLLGLPLSTAHAQIVELCGHSAQGELLVGHAPEGTEHAFLDDTELTVLPDGSFLFAFGRDAKEDHTLQLATADNIETFSLNIKKTPWDIQKINGVPPRKVEPTDLDLRKINQEHDDLQRALSYHTQTPFWQKGFIMPVTKGRTSGNFGGQRIMNGIKKSPHRGLDIAAPENSPVYASADGIVTLSGGDYYYTGNVVVIDHGQNLSTISAHLKGATVKKGDKVKQGDIIGHVGKTGRATGPHLHWGASLNGTRFQPLSLLKIGDKSFCSNI